MIRCFDNRHRAKRAVQGLQKLGLVLKTEVIVTRDAQVYVVCNTRDRAAAAILATGTEAEAPDPRLIVELYRGPAVVRFQMASGGGVVGAPVGKPARRAAGAAVRLRPNTPPYRSR